MKRQIAVGLSIVAVAAGVGWRLAGRPVASAGLDEIRVIERSEHSHPGPSDALAGIRIRLSPSNFGYERTVPAREIPRIAIAAE